MNIWIVTIGNSDLQLRDNKNWSHLASNARNNLQKIGYINYNKPELTPLEKDGKNKKKELIYASPSKILGLVYSEELLEQESTMTGGKYYDDILFPLLDNFTSKLHKNNIKLERIIYLLTDQENIFSRKEKSKIKCPYWQDTITMQPILEKYFKEHYPDTISEYKVLKPRVPNNDNELTAVVGLDDWNNVLTLVQKELAKITVDSSTKVYVSHQAGTPAISSAVQFATLALFGNQVKFLVSNEFDDRLTSILEGSNYLRGIQIQQSKTLITNGSPGGAKTLLKQVNCSDKEIVDKLENFVNIFNIKSNSTDSNQDDFQVEVAIQRVCRSLELIEIYFEQENYLQGITLLAAAHETFLKAAITHQLESFKIIEENKFNFKPLDVIKWTNKGLFFEDDELKQKIKVNNISMKQAKFEILDKLNFPVDCKDKNLDLRNKITKQKEVNFNCTNSNNALYLWLKRLSKEKVKFWKLLEWIGKYERRREKDKRNQLMHNLRGAKKDEIIKYLLGYDIDLMIKKHNQDDFNKMPVSYFYNKYVKKQMIEAIDYLELPYKKEPKLQQQLEELANELNSC